MFGAVSSISKANYKKSVMGNELMKHTMKVNSSECVVCAISPRQIMLARKAFRANAFCPRYAGVVNSKNWRRALTFAKTIAKMETVTKVNALRCTSLYQFVDSGVCESIAEQCTEQSVAAGEYFCQIGDEADRAWILLEGTVDAVIEGAVTARYTKYGTLFGETAFVEEGNGLRGASLIAVEDAHCYCIPRRTIESLCLDPLLVSMNCILFNEMCHVCSLKSILSLSSIQSNAKQHSNGLRSDSAARSIFKRSPHNP